MRIEDILAEAWAAIKTLVVLTALLGLAYPLTVTYAAKTLFPKKTSGSLIIDGGRTEGSALIGQQFQDPKYFWSRPSATSPYAYNATSSGASNLGPNNPTLLDAVRARVASLRAANPNQTSAVPADLVTASASGLDPDISPKAAFYQVARVAQKRHLSASEVQTLIQAHIQGPFLGFWGQSRVNVLELNLALDALSRGAP